MIDQRFALGACTPQIAPPRPPPPNQPSCAPPPLLPERSQQAERGLRRGRDSGERGTERKGGEGEKEEKPPGEGEEKEKTLWESEEGETHRERVGKTHTHREREAHRAKGQRERERDPQSEG